MQQIGDELVVALEVEVADVKENHAVDSFGALAKNFNGFAVAFEQRPEMFGDQRQLDHFGERSISQLGNDARWQTVLWRRFNDQAKLRGRFRQLDGRLWRGVLRAIDNVTPMDQVFERLRVKAEFFLGNRGDKFCAGFIVRLVKHVWAGMTAELLGVSGREKRTLMVVEPPGHFRRVGVLEIDDGVFVAVKKAGRPWLRSTMGHTGEAELRGGIELFPVEAVEKSGGSGPIKAAVMEAQPDAGHVLGLVPFGFSCLLKAGTKPFRVAGREKEVKRKALMGSTRKKSHPARPDGS